MTKNNPISKPKQSSLVFGTSVFLTLILNIFLVAITFNEATIPLNIGSNTVNVNGSMKGSFRLLWTLISIALAILLALLAYAIASYAVDSGNLLAYAGAFVVIVGSILFILAAFKPRKFLK